MTDFRTTERWLGRVLLVALVALLAVVVREVAPWSRDAAVTRPDTGEAVARLSGDAVAPVLGALLLRVYSAFGEEEEGAIYDGLATAVSGDLLPELYLQRRRAMVLAPPETAGSAEINEVRLDEMDVLRREDDHVRLRATWTVTGLLGHEDHRHERVNRYTAEMTLGPVAGAWRLTAFDLDQVRREDVPLFLDPFE